MSDPRGVNLLPASGEWVYDPLPHRAAHAGESLPAPVNIHAAPDGTRTDYSLAIDQLQARYPGCTTVSLVVAWFGDATDVTRCQIYPATTYPGGTAEALVDGAWQPDPWRCSGLTAASPELIPLSTSGGAAVYGGDAVRSGGGALHPRPQGARAARRLLPLPPHGLSRLSLARPHRLCRRGPQFSGGRRRSRLPRERHARPVHARRRRSHRDLCRCA